MKKFEYKFLPQPRDKSFTEILNIFNYLGEDGWELCCHEYGVFIFKRGLKP